MNEIKTLPGTERFLVARRIVPKGEANIFAELPEQIRDTITEVHYANGEDPDNVGLEGTYGADLPPDLAARFRRATNLIELMNISQHGMGYAGPTNELDDLEVEPVGVAPRLWRAAGTLNQGREGSCVGHGVRAWMNGEPVMTPPSQGDSAPEIYHWCQKNDGHDFSSGTTIEAGVKYCVEHGYADKGGYVKGYDAFVSFLSGTGGIFIGADWYEGQHRPDSQGYVRPTGRRTGGHCVWVHALLDGGDVQFQNSWGDDWGRGGFGKLSQEDLKKLMLSDHWTAAALVQKGGEPGPAANFRGSVTDFYKNTENYYYKDGTIFSKNGPEWKLTHVPGKVRK